MFIKVRHFSTSLLFLARLEPTQVEHITDLHCKNALAYYSNIKLTKNKIFITLGPGVHPTKIYVKRIGSLS